MASHIKGEIVTIHTGEFEPVMVEEPAKAKQFRRRKQAETICGELAKAYAGIGATPVIHLYVGDKQ